LLPPPECDPLLWAARTQDAWDDLRAALKAADGEPPQIPSFPDIGHVPTSDIVASLRAPDPHKTLFSVPGPFYPDLSPQPPGRRFEWTAPGHYGRSTIVPVALVAAQRLQDLQRERDDLMRDLGAAHAILLRLIDANGEQNYGIVAAARKLLGMPESRLNPEPDSEHYHE